MFHTRFFGSQEEGDREFDLMKAGLEEVLRIIPASDDASTERMSDVCIAIEVFVKRFE